MGVFRGSFQFGPKTEVTLVGGGPKTLLGKLLLKLRNWYLRSMR